MSERQAEAFVMDGLGEWPRTVFSNQTALLGPPSDPAGVRGSADAVEAFARIAKARAPFVVNDLDGQRYVAEIAEGARALQGFLLAAETQAKMRSIRYPGTLHAVWAPAGRNNRYAVLPRG